MHIDKDELTVIEELENAYSKKITLIPYSSAEPLLGFGAKIDEGHVISLSLSAYPGETLPASIEFFTKLRTLDLSHTRLKKIPSTIGKLNSLEYLYIFYSRNLEFLPESLCKLQSLKSIRLKKNQEYLFSEELKRHLIKINCDVTYMDKEWVGGWGGEYEYYDVSFTNKWKKEYNI